jgi:hypothetical protein
LHPGLARGPANGRFGGFRLVGRDDERNMTEGRVMQKIGGKWYVLCSSSRDEPTPGAGHYRRTRHLLVTLNGTQYYAEVLGYGTDGDVYVMDSDQIVKGREFATRDGRNAYRRRRR